MQMEHEDWIRVRIICYIRSLNMITYVRVCRLSEYIDGILSRCITFADE